MNRSLFQFKAVIALAFAFVIVNSGCRENTLISSKLSPANDTARVKADTLYTCVTHTFFDDYIFTSLNLNGLPIYQAVGGLTDSFFGTMSGATYFQINPPSPGFTFDTSYIIDSVVLVLPYGNFTFGDTSDITAQQAYQVFYMNDSIGYNSTYYPSTQKPIDYANPLSGAVSVNVYHLKDSIGIGGVNYRPALRIKLNKNSVMARLNNALYEGSMSSADKTLAFVNAFNGICVKPADTRVFSKAVPYFRLDPLGTDIMSQAGLVVFHHGSNSDTAPRVFSFSQTDCAHYNSIVKSYSRYPANQLFHSVQANDNVIAIQNKPGASIDIKISGLKSIPKGVIINQAQLQISMLGGSSYHNFAAPDQIYPVGIANGTYPAGVAAGAEYSIEDRKPETSLSPYAILDGGQHTITYGTTPITTYTIGMPREVIASIAAGNDTLHLHLHGTQVLYGAYRMLAAGGNYPDKNYKTKLIVVYSSLKN